MLGASKTFYPFFGRVDLTPFSTAHVFKSFVMSAPETVAAPAPVEEVKPTEVAEPTPAPAAEEPKVEATVSTCLI